MNEMTEAETYQELKKAEKQLIELNYERIETKEKIDILKEKIYGDASNEKKKRE